MKLYSIYATTAVAKISYSELGDLSTIIDELRRSCCSQFIAYYQLIADRKSSFKPQNAN
ncbi:uncharacterized protein CANTADRAFT_26254, partial [Suhomyces tanzawaensis NRRL Y-17324]